MLEMESVAQLIATYGGPAGAATALVAYMKKLGFDLPKKFKPFLAVGLAFGITFLLAGFMAKGPIDIWPTVAVGLINGFAAVGWHASQRTWRDRAGPRG